MGEKDDQPKTITLDDARRLIEETTAPLHAKIAELEEAGRRAPEKKDEEKVYTHAELEAAVQAGQITDVQKADILERQRQRQVEENARKAAREEIEQTNRKATVESAISAYAELVPDVLKAGSNDRARVERAYRRLVAQGQPETKSTELVALEVVFGDLTALRAARAGRAEPETHRDAGGDGARSRSSGGDGSDGPKSKLTERERAFYQKGIDSGRYANWAAVDDELKFANPHVRARAAARLH